MSNKRTVLLALWRKLPVMLTAGGFIALGVVAYLYSAVMADIADTELAAAIVQEALQALIVAQVIRAFSQRWDEFTPVQRLGWGLVNAGIILNLARGHFSATPLTLSFALLYLGLIIITWRLMAATRREKKLAQHLYESEQIRLQQDEALADLQADVKRIGQQSKEFEIRARDAEQRLAELEQP